MFRIHGQRCRLAFRSIALVLVALAGITGWVSAQESVSYRIERLTVSASAAQASSSNYELSLTFGEQVPSGAASRCNNGFQQTLGFWSVLGEAPVPIYLQVQQVPGSPEDVNLAWSGASDMFDLYRSEEGDSVQTTLNLVQTLSECATSDSPPIIPGIIYYLVVPAGG